MQDAGVFFDLKKPPASCLAKLVYFDESIKLFSQSSSLTDQIKNSVQLIFVSKSSNIL